MRGRIETLPPTRSLGHGMTARCRRYLAAAAGLLLCVSCASPEAYRLPEGGTPNQRSLDFHDCRQLAGMQRDPLQQLAIEEDCMGARGYVRDDASAS